MEFCKYYRMRSIKALVLMLFFSSFQSLSQRWTFEDVAINPATPVGPFNTLYSCAWCCNGSHKMLAVEGAGGPIAQAFSWDGSQLTSINFDIAPSTQLTDGAYCSWCCDNDDQLLVLGNNGNIITSMAYYFDGLQNKLINIPSFQTIGFIRSTAWCCNGSDKYLAVGMYQNGLPASAQVFKYNSMAHQFIEYSFPTGAPHDFQIESCPWCCIGNDKLLAVVGYYDSIGQIFRVDDNNNQMVEISFDDPPAFSYGWQCAWCCDEVDKLIAYVGEGQAKLRVYRYDVNSDMFVTVATDPIVETSGLYTASWCCNGDTKLLAVAGASGANAQVFRYDSSNQRLVNIPLDVAMTGTAFFYSSWCCGGNDNFAAFSNMSGGKKICVYRYDQELQQMINIPFAQNQVKVNNQGFQVEWCCDGTDRLLALVGNGTQKMQVFKLVGSCDSFEPSVVSGPVTCMGQLYYLNAVGGTEPYLYSLNNDIFKEFASGQALMLTNPPAVNTLVIRDSTPEPYGPCFSETFELTSPEPFFTSVEVLPGVSI